MKELFSLEYSELRYTNVTHIVFEDFNLMLGRRQAELLNLNSAFDVETTFLPLSLSHHVCVFVSCIFAKKVEFGFCSFLKKF